MSKEDLWDNEIENEDGTDDLLGDDFEKNDQDDDVDRKPDKGPDIDDIDEDDDLFEKLTDYDDYDMDDDVEEDKDEDEKPDVKKEDKSDEKPPVELSEDDEALAALYADVLNTVGKDTVLKIKGKEVKAGDLAPNELKMYLQKGIRSNDVYHEAKRLREEALREREKTVSTVRQSAPVGGQAQKTIYDNLPEALRPTDLDTPEVKTLKEVIAGLDDRMRSIQVSTDENHVATKQAQLEGELTKLSGDFPMGSVDESIAVKYFRPEMELSELMRETHQHYTSDEFLGKALEHNPSYLRELKNEAVKEFLATKQARGARTAPTKAFRKASSDRVSTKPKVRAANFDQADDLAKRYVAEMWDSDKD